MTSEPTPYTDPTDIRAPGMHYTQTAAEVEETRELLRREVLGGGSPTAREAAQAIVRWVHRSLRPGAVAVGSFGVARSLSEIFARQKVSCREFAVLTCYFLRCLAIPARLTDERMLTEFTWALAPLALMPRGRAGPNVQGHVWVELNVDGTCAPADAELDIFGIDEWVAKRLGQSWRIPAGFGGVSTTTTWLFPLAVYTVDRRGRPAEKRSRHYLLDGLSTRLTEAQAASTAFEVWEAGVHYFERRFPWDSSFAGIRLALQTPRLRAMTEALRTLMQQ